MHFWIVAVACIPEVIAFLQLFLVFMEKSFFTRLCVEFALEFSKYENKKSRLNLDFYHTHKTLFISTGDESGNSSVMPGLSYSLEALKVRSSLNNLELHCLGCWALSCLWTFPVKFCILHTDILWNPHPKPEVCSSTTVYCRWHWSS